MNYLGSKHHLTNFINTHLEEFCGSLEDKTVCDLFAGTGIVANSITCKKIIVNDIEAYSFCLLQQLFNGVNNTLYYELIDFLNIQKLSYNFLIEQLYSLNGKAKRNYFTPQNAQKIDAIRIQIKKWYKNKQYPIVLLNALLASLIEASDKVANTASMYGAYLKNTKYSASKKLILLPIIPYKKNADVYNEEGCSLLKKIQGDVLYLDPPYNHRQYGLNYHVLNTIVHYKNFTPRGKSGYGSYFRSKWCQTKFVQKELHHTLKDANFKYIVLSYNNEGILNNSIIKKEFEKFGKYHRVSKTHNKFRVHAKSASKTIEYLHFLEKQ